MMRNIIDVSVLLFQLEPVHEGLFLYILDFGRDSILRITTEGRGLCHTNFALGLPSISSVWTPSLVTFPCILQKLFKFFVFAKIATFTVILGFFALFGPSLRVNNLRRVNAQTFIL